MKTPVEILQEKYMFYDPMIQQKDVELCGEQVIEMMEAYAEQFKNYNLHVVMRSILEQKESAYSEICAWFENEYSPSFTDEDEVAEWNKKASEVNAQIKLIMFLLG